VDARELAFAGIARQAELIASGEVTSRELIEVYLERIARLNPRLNAFRVVFGERALLEADQADARARAGDRRPLLGVPIAVKDNIDVAGEVTTVGTRAHGAPAAQDAELVRRARAAGAVVLGKTLVPELCIWPFTESATFGMTRNPWDPGRTPGGSSGGSAAAVAAGLVGAALGSDGGGSIRIPAAWCGLYGLKPQRDRVPLHPHTADWHGLSVFGVLTRGVRDTALFHDAVQGIGPSAGDGGWSAAAAAEPRALRVAVASNFAPPLVARLHDENRRALRETAELLRSRGHSVLELSLDYAGPRCMGCFVPRFLRGIHDDAVALPHFGRLERRTRAMARAGGLIGAPLLARARAGEAIVREHLNSAWRDHDVLLTPVTAVPPPPVGHFESRGWLWTFLGVSGQTPYTPAWNLTGQPACSVPAGFDARGLPRAVQLIAHPGDEPTLLSLAAQLERVRPWVQTRPAMAA
jgi:amidase